MKGQWLGEYTGNSDGTIMLNIDEVGGQFLAVAYLRSTNRLLPDLTVYIETKDLNSIQEVDARLLATNPDTGLDVKWSELKKTHYKNVRLNDKPKVCLSLTDEGLHIVSKSDLGLIEFECELKKASLSKYSKILSSKMSWNEFKEFVSKLSNLDCLFRGQEEAWRLSTTFHRKKRYRIGPFVSEDVKILHQKLSSITDHYFDLSVPDQKGAFLNLLQHHGYPTPLLDWSYSPFVSAFFAFRGYPINYKGNKSVRIFIFDNAAWKKKYPQITVLDPKLPHFSVNEFIALNNPRLIPQQAVTTVTNLDDIESYLQKLSDRDNFKYIAAIDIPAEEREVAMRDLRLMGITAGSMFPGVDGVCEEVREMKFSD